MALNTILPRWIKKHALTFIRWRERRGWAAHMRWQRASWWLHGYPLTKTNDQTNS